MKKLILIAVICTLVFSFGRDSRAKNMAPVSLSTNQQVTLNDDFSATNPAWKQWSGQWVFDQGVLRQTATRESYPLFLRTDQQYSEVDISVDFKPLSGRIDASGGLVFRAMDQDNFYLVRANALENNFRLYIFKQGFRHQIASARVTPPELGKFHQLRVVAQGDHLQAYLDGTLYLDYHDSSYIKGYVGLWTKSDSVTEFDNLRISGIVAE